MSVCEAGLDPVFRSRSKSLPPDIAACLLSGAEMSIVEEGAADVSEKPRSKSMSGGVACSEPAAAIAALPATNAPVVAYAAPLPL